MIKTLWTIVLGTLVAVLITTAVQGCTCNNSDCEFEQLAPPVIMAVRSESAVVCVDATGKIWSSHRGWKIANALLTSDFQPGDTIIYGPTKPISQPQTDSLTWQTK